MPFDGGEFFRPRSPEPTLPPAAAMPNGLRAWRAWTWAGLVASLPAEPAGRGPESLDQGAGASTAALLRAARALIEDEWAWTKGAYHTMGGRRCAVGALRAAALAVQGRYGRAVRQEAHGLLLDMAAWRGFESVERMNDNSNHAQVIAVFEAAIALAEDCRPALGLSSAFGRSGG